MPRRSTAARSFDHVATLASLIGAALTATTLAGGPPAYEIIDMGIVSPGDFGSQANSISSGGVATGRSLGEGSSAFRWTEAEGRIDLASFASRPFLVANGANDVGQVVGTGATTFFGSGPLPLIWEGDDVTMLPLPVGQTLGRANDVNDAGVAVGSVGGGSVEFAVVYEGDGASIITATTNAGEFMTTAFAINADGLVAGIGQDPAAAARNVGLVHDVSAGTMRSVGALPGRNGAICFAIGDGGHVVGSTMMNQGSGVPFIWTDGDGMLPIPLPAGTSQGSARGVNASGQAVGNASNAFSIPFYFDGETTHRVQDLLPPDTPWDLSMNTSSSALGISDDGVIVGTGELNGDVRAYAMIPIEAACDADLDDDGMVGGADLTILLAAWGSAKGSPADLDGNGTVNGADLTILLAAWGPCA